MPLVFGANLPKECKVRNLIAVLLALAVPSVLPAQTKNTDWQNLNRLRPGEKIQVVDMNKNKHSGAFSSFTDQAITLHTQSGDETIQRANVLRVRGRSHRLRNVIIAGGVGAGAGAGIGYGANSCTKGCFGLGKGTTAGIAAALGFIGGAAVGAFIPSHETVYRAAP